MSDISVHFDRPPGRMKPMHAVNNGPVGVITPPR